MTIDKEQFYSTPLELAKKLVSMFPASSKFDIILEPSAG